MSKFYAPGKANVKGIIAIILLVAGFLIAAFANQWAVRLHLVGYISRTWPDRTYGRVAFTRDGSLAGISIDGPRLTVERYARSGNDSTKWTVNVEQNVTPEGSQLEWVLDHDVQRIAYTGSKGIVVRPLCEPGSAGCAGSALPLPAATRSLLAFSFVSGHRLAAAFNDGSVLVWDTESGNQVGKLSFVLEGADQARWAGDYLAVVASNSRTARVYRLIDGPSLKQVEESRTPFPPFTLITPGTGQIGYISAGAIYYRGGTRNSPGTVRDAVIGSNDMLVGGGEFNGLQVLADKEDPYPLIEDEELKIRAYTVAAEGSRFAYSGQGGTGLVGLTTESRVTPSGRRYNFLGLGIALIGGLLAASSLLFDLVGMSFKAQGTGKKSRKTLLDPDPGLVNAFVDGKAVLWAGAGLSAQAGFPTRRTFLTQTLQTADSETWLEPKLLMKLYQQVQSGQYEQALDEIIETLHYQRLLLIQHFKVVYCRLTPMSPCHKIVRRLPVAAAITTNYDGCLEMLGPMWANNVLTLRQGGHRGAAEQDQFFLLRLYGDPRILGDVKLSHKEFADSVQADPTLGDTLQELFNKKTMFFVGCAAQGLAEDLKLMPKIGKSSRKHYAVVGVGAGNWDKSVQILEEQYGIHCIVCSEETIAAELPKFLETLAAEIDEARSDRTKRGRDVVELSVKRAASGA
jgi:hypothetical protein